MSTTKRKPARSSTAKAGPAARGRGEGKEKGKGQLKRAATEALLVDAFGRIVQRHGLRNVGVNEVVKEAGVGKALLYRYFGDFVGLARAWPEMTFVLCGPPGDDAKALRERVRLPNLQFHLGIDDAHKAWAYAHCAGFLFPSLTEGFGLPPIEAMHFGKPVFLARRTSLPEIGGDAADYFDDFEPASMRRVVERGLARDAREPQRADAVRRHAARFDWDHAAAAYLALYARLLGLAAPAAGGSPAA